MSDWLHPYDEGYPHEEVMSAEPMTIAGRTFAAWERDAATEAEMTAIFGVHPTTEDIVVRIEREAAALLRQRLQPMLLAVLPPIDDEGNAAADVAEGMLAALFDAALEHLDRTTPSRRGPHR